MVGGEVAEEEQVPKKPNCISLKRALLNSIITEVSPVLAEYELEPLGSVLIHDPLSRLYCAVKVVFDGSGRKEIFSLRAFFVL
jgi:hypothetical protein